jgi:hypothetical protein
LSYSIFKTYQSLTADSNEHDTESQEDTEEQDALNAVLYEGLVRIDQSLLSLSLSVII